MPGPGKGRPGNGTWHEPGQGKKKTRKSVRLAALPIEVAHGDGSNDVEMLGYNDSNTR
tara:strand:+ start:248 stop:421 length:174 start_codon:yes stop_codon:yes gene_type:complete